MISAASLLPLRGVALTIPVKDRDDDCCSTILLQLVQKATHFQKSGWDWKEGRLRVVIVRTSCLQHPDAIIIVRRVS
jgi:hypothetical protein